MVGYNTEIVSTAMNFQVPKETTKGQYKLEAIVSGCEIPTIVLPVAQQSKEEEKEIILNNNVGEDYLVISPNPADKAILLKSKRTIKVVEILDSYGKKVDRFRPNNLEFLLDVSNYSNGTYLVLVEFENGDNETKRFVVSH